MGATEYFKLNENGSISVVLITNNLGKITQYIGIKEDSIDWDKVHNELTHINAREFNDAYNLVKENI